VNFILNCEFYVVCVRMSLLLLLAPGILTVIVTMMKFRNWWSYRSLVPVL